VLDFDSIFNCLKRNLNNDYLGSQLFDSIVNRKIAAVLVIIHNSESGTSILFTKRSENLENHANEISFPGGNFVLDDLNTLRTAIRETHEEIGIAVPTNSIVGLLEPVQTVTSNYFIYPYVAMLEQVPLTRPNEEVQKIFSIPIDYILTSYAINSAESVGEQSVQSQQFLWKNNTIWGATARILNLLVGHIEKAKV
jgi:8-oxo-dGTP pyrophosphatase MutT (NUDIX family)